jgi:hypothetical protein
MANVLQLALASYTNYLTTALNSLADGSSVLGAAIDNSSSRNTLVHWRLNLNTLTPAAGGYVELYCLPGDSAAGNFAEGDASTLPQAQYLMQTWYLRNASSTPYHFAERLPMPVYSKWLIRNKAGVAFNAGSNVLAYSLSNLTVE